MPGEQREGLPRRVGIDRRSANSFAKRLPSYVSIGLSGTMDSRRMRIKQLMLQMNHSGPRWDGSC